jgi:hypothetical protein
VTETKPTPKTWRERFGPRVMPRKEYLASNVFVSAILETISAAVIAGLAVSRATGHRLSAVTAGVILGAGPALYASIIYLLALYGGLSETVAGRVLPDSDSKRPVVDGDPLSPRRLWLKAFERTAAAGLWGAGLAVLVVAALNRRHAGFAVMFIGILAAFGLSSVIGSLASQAEGIRIGLARIARPNPRPARRRAWRELALPFALLTGVINAGFTWVLFHDYTVGTNVGTHVLTEQQVLADLLILALLNVGGAILVCGRAGRAEASLGLVTFEDPEAQLPPPRALHGPQALVYAVVATFLLSGLVRLFLPPLPNLAEAMIARGLLSAFLVFVAGGFAYVRGAANAVAAAAASGRERRVPAAPARARS